MKINGVEVVDNECSVPLITFGVPTRNGEIFSKEVVEECIMKDKFVNERLENALFYGEFRNDIGMEYFTRRNNTSSLSRYFYINPERIAIHIRDLCCTEDMLRGNIKLSEPLGTILPTNINYRTVYRIILKKANDDDNNVKSFILITFDLVPDTEEFA
jgi:hypothetical protein